MSNYSKGKIYALRSFQTDDIYIGSTIQSLKSRMWKHKNNYKRWKNNEHCYVTSYNILKFEDCYIELIDECPCDNKEQLLKKEGECIREMDCVNKCIPTGNTSNCDFKNGKIYAIRSHKTDDVYIGSTTNTLIRRFQKHKASFNQWLNKNNCYVTCFEIIKFDDCYIELICDFPCETQEELRKKEGECIREIKCINKCIAGRTREEWVIEHKQELKEYHADYYKEHKEEHNENSKEYRKNNHNKLKKYDTERYKTPERQAQIKERAKLKYHCDVCDKEVALCKKARHEKCKEHLMKCDPQELKKYQKECECGSLYMITDKERHLNSKKHIKWIETNEE